MFVLVSLLLLFKYGGGKKEVYKTFRDGIDLNVYFVKMNTKTVQKLSNAFWKPNKIPEILELGTVFWNLFLFVRDSILT